MEPTSGAGEVEQSEVVASGEESPALRVLDEPLGDGGFVTLARRQCDRQRPPSQVHDDVNLRRKTAATAT